MLQISRLTYTYEGKKIALRDISMDFNKGEIIGLIGRNGSGKSTLFLNIVGVLKPSKGEILYHGKPIRYDKKSLYELRKKIGIVFQDPDQQIFYSDVYEDLAFALRNLGLSEEIIKERIEEALIRVDALHLKDEAVQFLSYGQKKRIAIASVLAMKQEMVLLDEPTAGLDPVSVERMIEIIIGMKEAGIKVLVSSHDMDFIYKICDYLYVLDEGRLIDEGTREKVFSKESDLLSIGLGEPWLMKVHKYMNLPFFETEEALYSFWKEKDTLRI